MMIIDCDFSACLKVIGRTGCCLLLSWVGAFFGMAKTNVFMSRGCVCSVQLEKGLMHYTELAMADI